MQLESRDGIRCDNCGMESKQDFDYYSCDFRKVPVYNSSYIARSTVMRLPVAKSLDVCPMCWDRWAKAIVTNNRNISGKGVLCDLTGEVLHGDFVYYFCRVSSVSVRMKNQPYQCSECGLACPKREQACPKCKSKSLVCKAAVTADEDYLELNVCSRTYDELVNTAKSVASKSGGWSSDASV